MGAKESIITELKLRQVTSLEEIVANKLFFIDTSYNSDKEVPVYPVTEQANLSHNLLNLYGTHWRYFIDEQLELRKEDGDTQTVLDNIRVGKKVSRFAHYAFTQKYLDAKKSLWIFTPKTPGWKYYQDIIIPAYIEDQLEYDRIKMKATNPPQK